MCSGAGSSVDAGSLDTGRGGAAGSGTVAEVDSTAGTSRGACAGWGEGAAGEAGSDAEAMGAVGDSGVGTSAVMAVTGGAVATGTFGTGTPSAESPSVLATWTNSGVM